MPLPRWLARFNLHVTNRILGPLARYTCHLLLIKAASFDFFGLLAPGSPEFQEGIEEKLLFGGRYYQAAHTTYIVGSRAGNEAACFIDVDVHSLFASRKSDALFDQILSSLFEIHLQAFHVWKEREVSDTYDPKPLH